jgi:hypothetical protein
MQSAAPLRFRPFFSEPDKKSRRLAGFYYLLFSRLATDAYQSRCPVVRGALIG